MPPNGKSCWFPVGYRGELAFSSVVCLLSGLLCCCVVVICDLFGCLLCVLGLGLGLALGWCVVSCEVCENIQAMRLASLARPRPNTAN